MNLTKKHLIYLLIGVLGVSTSNCLDDNAEDNDPNYVGYNSNAIHNRKLEQEGGGAQQPMQRSCPAKCDNGGGGGGSAKQKATQLAQNAAKEAKAASDAQQAAGQQAAHQVKSQLAEKACQANNAAQAALSGKQALVDQIEEQIREAEAVVQDESSSQNGCQSTAQVAQQLCIESKQQVKILAAAVQNAQSVAANADKLNEAMSDEMQAKDSLLESAKRRIEQLLVQLNAARQDLANTKCSANKAAAAAQQAKQNAMRNKRDEGDSNDSST